MIELLTVLTLIMLFIFGYLFSFRYFKQGKATDRNYALLFLATVLALLIIYFLAQGLAERAFPLFTLRSTMLFLILIIVIINVLFLAITRIFMVNRYTIPLLIILALFSLYAGQSGKSGEARLYLAEPLAVIHIPLFIVAYGFFTLSAFLGIVYLSLDNKLKRKLVQPELSGSPALEQTDFFANHFVLIGLIFLSLGIITGALFARRQPLAFTPLDPKVISSILLWVYYAIYLGLRQRAGWVGRRACYIIIAGFIMVLMAYFVANVFIPTRIHGYI